ncbi:M20/M25/M40 family metallo-hydrolase [Kangiella sp. HZ709]|uniref:M20/M25/M40 family metallo-hydrolase n=1 Tax=Kangiella sp. HZ709 TaxID=2666328 RepID=UPI0012B13AB2|nr:M20/M25/M40 family metallo-hydrolase [Kangiella sp. HZ709]MRX27339.1 M20/M25/M40 family metallo-hydrolase [Kangiella sp. HZ709]
MKFKSLFISSLLLASQSALLTAETPSLEAKDIKIAEQLRDEALKSSKGYAIVESLTTEVGPRMAGTAGDAAAVAWGEAKLKELGFDKVWKEPVTFPTWKRGVETAEVVSPFPQPLVITALGFSVGTPKGGLSAEIKAYETLQDLKDAPENDAKGKIVFIKYRMKKARDGSGYGPAVSARGSGAVEAAKKGAVGILIRSIGTQSHRMAHTGMMRYAKDVNKIPAAALSSPDADLLENMLTRGKPVTVKLTLGSYDGPEYTSYNVIGEITGSEKPEEYVLIGGHLDSWDLGTGALDDGAGIAITTAAAELISRLPERPKRSIRVIMWANEEQGLVGARAYAEMHKDKLANLITGAESDFGADRIWRIDSRVKPEALSVAKDIAKVMEPLGIKYGNNRAGGGPDLIPLRQLGVSVFSLRQDGTDYFDYHHTPDDTLDKIEKEALDQNTAAYVVLAYLAAQMNGDFGQKVE